jgi:hypothetical protein
MWKNSNVEIKCVIRARKRDWKAVVCQMNLKAVKKKRRKKKDSNALNFQLDQNYM